MHKPLRGFTLMEVLVAVALMAMLGMILATSTSSLMGAIADTRETMDWYHTARVALGRMDREIGMAYVSKHQGELRTTKTVFLGKPGSLTMSYMGHRRLARNAAESDEGFVEYKLEKDNKTGETLLIRREEAIIDDTPQKGGRREVLARGVKKLTFAYWDMDNESWKSEWKVEIDNALQEQMQKAQTAAGVTAATGNAALGQALAKQAQQARTHTAEDNWLPARVRIQLTLETSAGDLPFETQTRVRMQEPLDLSGVYVPKPYENSLNPYAAFPGQTPANFALPQAGGMGGMGAMGGLGGMGGLAPAGGLGGLGR